MSTRTARASAAPGRGLFAEDFDAPAGITDLDAAEPETEAAPPVFDAEAVEAAREQGFADGLGRGLAQAAQDRAEISRQLLATLVERLEGADAASRAAAEESALVVARLLLTVLARLFPTLCARHGAGEAVALARAVLPRLQSEAQVTVRVSPHVEAALRAVIDTLEPDQQPRITLVPTDAVAPGDLQVSWNNGRARRDMAAIWNEVAGVLARYGIDASEPAADGRDGAGAGDEDGTAPALPAAASLAAQ